MNLWLIKILSLIRNNLDSDTVIAKVEKISPALFLQVFILVDKEKPNFTSFLSVETKPQYEFSKSNYVVRTSISFHPQLLPGYVKDFIN